MKKKIFLLAIALALFVCPYAQTKDVKYKAVLISTEDGGTIKGAVISLWPGNIKTISQNNGSFEISCNCIADSIRISHVNFVPLYLSMKNNSSLPEIIRLQPAVKQLDEVQVNTGYQALPKERVTGSFEKVNNQLFNQQVGTNVLDRLETIANGLYVDKKTSQSTVNFTVRGLSTIQGPKAPLVIVDNFPYEGDLNNINPNDVESVTILKDAAASSIWGTRAGNGVIVITTKKARFNQPLRVEFNSNITIAEKPDLFYYNNISPSDLIDVEQFLYGKGFYSSQISSSAKPTLTPVVELLIKKATGSMPAAEADAKINALRNHDIRDDFSRYQYQPAVNKQYALSMRGGSNNIAYLFSTGYDNNVGSLNDKYNRISFKSENTFKVNKNLLLIAGVTYTQTSSSAGRVGYSSLATGNGNLPMYTRLADSAGNFLPVMRQYRQPYLDTVGGGKLLDWNYYLSDDHNHIDNNNRVQSLLINLSVNWKIFKGLSADIKYQYERQSTDNSTVYDQDSYLARSLINSYSQLNRTTGVVTYKVPKGGIITNNNGLLQSHNIRGQINFSKSWKRHEITAIAGGEVRQALTTSNALRTYGYNDDILTFVPVDYTIPYPNFVTGSTSFIPNDQTFIERLNRFVSFYGNAAYTYKTRYSITASARRDASNLFGVRTNDRWTPLWSAGGGWDVSKEKFYHFKPVPYLKLRTTYGVSGNADASRSGFTVLTYTIASPYTLLPTARVSQFVNPDLRWEKVSMLNLGLDFKALNGRIQGSVEYYHKKAKDLLGFSAVDYTGIPTNSLIKNVATMKADGWDIAINSVNIKSPVMWTSNLNFNTNKDKVVDYFLTSRVTTSYLGGGFSVSALAGRPVYAIYAFPWAGLDPLTGDPRSYLNGQPSKDYTSLLGSKYTVDSLSYKGRLLPPIFGSLGNTLSYKGISLTVRLSYKFGYYFMRNSVNYNNLFGSRQGHGDYALRWQKPGDEVYTSVPSMVYPAVSKRDQLYNNSEVLVERADHVRLQYITVDYDVKRAFKRLPFASLNCYVNANNLGIIWRANKYGVDPDYRDNSVLPSRNIAVGVKAGF